MNKNEVIEAVSKETGHPKTVVRTVMEALHETTVAALKRGDDVRLAGYGIYSVKRVAERVGRDPRTGGSIKIAEHTKVKFKPASVVSDAVNGK